MLDHDPISEFEDEKEDIPLIAIEKAKAEAVGEQQRKTQKEAPKPTHHHLQGVLPVPLQVAPNHHKKQPKCVMPLNPNKGITGYKPGSR